MKRALVCAVTFVLMAVGTAWSAVEYQATVLPLPQGFTGAFATAINDAGDIAGIVWGDAGDSSRRAVRWGHDGSITVFGEEGGYARAINNLGQVAGTVPYGSSGGTHGMVWNPDGTRRTLSRPGWTNIRINSIGDQGIVVGSGAYETQVPNAVYWLYDTATILGGGTAVDVNSSWEILVSNYGAIGSSCTLFKPGGSTVSFSGPEGSWHFAAASLNDNSEVFGSYMDHANSGYWLPYIWRQATGVTVLPFAPGDYHCGGLGGINNNGWAVGSVLGSAGSRLVVWESDGSIVELPNTRGGASVTARSINNSNWVVGGIGNNALLWQPIPEPSSLLALLCGLGGLVGMVWRKRR